MKNKFVCQGCGECCKVFGIERNNFLPLFEWEAEEYEELAKQKGINLNIKPIIYFLDKKSGVVFCLKYGMFNEPCPFLENNKCSIYDKRALSCKQFPIFETPEYINKEISPSCFLECPNFDTKKELQENFPIGKNYIKQIMINYFKETYNDCYDYAFQSNALNNLLANFLQTAIENKNVKTRKISKFDLSKYKIIPFFKFFVSKRLMDENARDFLIQTFKDKEAFQNYMKQKQDDRQSNNL